MFNLKYKRTRQWLLFWLSPFLYSLSVFPFIETDYEDTAVLTGILVLLLYYIFCFFRTIIVWLNGEQEIKDGYSKKFDPKVRTDWIMRELLRNEKGYNKFSNKKVKKLENELDLLIEKYATQTGTKKAIKAKVLKSWEYTPADAKKQEKRLNRIQHGLVAGKIICPHCGTKGKVRRKVGKQIEETRQSGLVGGLIGQKTLTSKGDITRFYCDNCQTKWTA